MHSDTIAFKILEHTWINKRVVHTPSTHMHHVNINVQKQRNSQQDIDFYNLKYVYHKNSHSGLSLCKNNFLRRFGICLQTLYKRKNMYKSFYQGFRHIRQKNVVYLVQQMFV